MLAGTLCLLALVAAAAAACAPVLAPLSFTCSAPETYFTAPLPRFGGCGDVDCARIRGLFSSSSSSSSGSSLVPVPGKLRFVVALAAFQNFEATLPCSGTDYLLDGFLPRGAASCGSSVWFSTFSDVSLVPELRFVVALRHYKNLEARFRSSAAYVDGDSCFGSPVFGLSNSFSGYFDPALNILSSRVFGTWDLCGTCVASTLSMALVCGVVCLVVACATLKTFETASPSLSCFGFGHTLVHLFGGTSLAAPSATSCLAAPLSLSLG